MTADDIIDSLEAGNQRFLNDEWHDRDYVFEQQQTAAGQHPSTMVLSCIDSRAPAEILFDAGIGDMFNARVAGNIINEDIAGSMEFACGVVGAKVVMVMGHTSCGAVSGAIDGVELGNLTGLLDRIVPAVAAVQDFAGERTSSNPEFVDAVARQNVLMTIERIREMSPLLRDLEANGEIRIVGAMYDVGTGVVEIFD